jgi:excisionase family DNA binding protein
MSDQRNLDRVYTPEQVAALLQLSKNTVYELINRGEIIAKRIGKVYRIPAKSLSFIFTGLDFDLYQSERIDLKNLPSIQKEIVKARKKL